MARKEVDASRVGAFGISRGGYSVLQLAGTAPTKVKSVVAVAGHPFHNEPSDQDMDEIVKTRNERAQFRFGQEDGPTWVPAWSPEQESAKVYKGSGHCAFDHQPEWGPIAFQWLAKNM